LIKEAEEAAAKVAELEEEVREATAVAEKLRIAHQSELGMPEHYDTVIRHRAKEVSKEAADTYDRLETFGVEHGISPEMQSQLRTIFAKCIDVEGSDSDALMDGVQAVERPATGKPGSLIDGHLMHAGAEPEDDEDCTFGPTTAASKRGSPYSPYAPDESEYPTMAEQRARLAKASKGRKPN